jgi:hypothetical protein
MRKSAALFAVVSREAAKLGSARKTARSLRK